MLKVKILDGIKSELVSLPLGNGGEMIKNHEERRFVSRSSEIKSIYYMLAKSKLPQTRR
jgi:hypothetical protein